MTDLSHEERGSGLPAVLLHQGVVDSRIWRTFLPLVEDRLRSIVYDQRGYGRSPKWAGPYSLVDDLVSVLDAAEVEQAALVGTSRGGGIAIQTALTHPERVSALLLVASALPGHRLELTGTPEQEARWEEAEERGDLEELAAIDMEFWAPMGVDDELRAMFIENAGASNGDDPAEVVMSAGRLGEIAVPTLVVTGARDVPAINEVGEILASEIRGAQSAVIQEADHMVQWRAPDELSGLVLEFLH